MSDQLQCIPECGLLFSNSGGLTHHQSVCKVFKGRQREVRAAAQRVREAARAQETRAGPSSTTSWAINLDIDEPVSSYSQVHDTAQARLGLGASELHQEQDKKCAAASGPAAESGRRFRSRSIAMLPHLEPTGYVPGFATPNPQQHCDDAAETGYRNSGSSLQTIPVREEDLSHAPSLPYEQCSTAQNPFGLYKIYPHPDSNYIDPDGFLTRGDFIDGLAAPLEVEGPLSYGMNINAAPTTSTLASDASPPNNPLASHPLGTARDVITPSILRLAEWYWSDDPDKSIRSFLTLVEIISSDDFDPTEIKEANWIKINQLLGLRSEQQDETSGEGLGQWFTETSWKRDIVTIDVPFDAMATMPGVRPYQVNNFYHRPLLDVIREKLSDPEVQERFHILPAELRWQPSPSAHNVRVYGEIYTSPEFAKAHANIVNSPPEPGCTRPRHIIALMFGSDATQLSVFGTQMLWPLYIFFGNESKLLRLKPGLKLGDQIAYLLNLPDSFKDWLRSNCPDDYPGYRLTDLATHCKHELFHAQWKIILDDEFINAYQHGIVVEWFDGHERRFYPRIFTYSADYPEKILVVTLRPQGLCPCPRCLVPKEDTPNMGQKMDMDNREIYARVDNSTRQDSVKAARTELYQENLRVGTVMARDGLKKQSLVPTENAFSAKLSGFGFNYFDMLTTDILHEFELNVWKNIFLQLLRILWSPAHSSIDELDQRYRQMPKFGHDTIRRFANNVSETKKMAARDWEDLLQCAIAAFEGLFEQLHDQRVLQLLYSLAHWHALAKLRMHTDHTLDLLDDWTAILGDDCWLFESKTCSVIKTVELAKEYNARLRSEARKKNKEAPQKAQDKQSLPIKEEPTERLTIRIPAPVHRATATHSTEPPTTTAGPSGIKRKLEVSVSAANSLPEQPSIKKAKAVHTEASNIRIPSRRVGGKRLKTLSLKTYTWHALGHVKRSIMMFGTTDSYSTQISELYHRFPKKNYRRTNRKDIPEQLSKIQMRQKRLKRLRKMLLPARNDGEHQKLPSGRYSIAKTQREPLHLLRWISTRPNNPSMQDFIPTLKRHLLPRLLKKVGPQGSQQSEQPVGENLEGDYNNVIIQGDRLYSHNLLHINYTTYNLRIEQDIINPSSDCRDIMLLWKTSDQDSSEKIDDHRFLYARIIGIFHANTVYRRGNAMGLQRHRLDFLWVRWFDTFGPPQPFLSKQLDVLAFPPVTRPDSFGFVDPEDVLRACHIKPRFSAGLAPHPFHRYSSSKKVHETPEWKQYLVNRFVDRDMVMRYHWGIGVGHIYSHGDAPQKASERSTGTQVEMLPYSQARARGKTPEVEQSAPTTAVGPSLDEQGHSSSADYGGEPDVESGDENIDMGPEAEAEVEALSDSESEPAYFFQVEHGQDSDEDSDEEIM